MQDTAPDQDIAVSLQSPRPLFLWLLALLLFAIYFFFQLLLGIVVMVWYLTQHYPTGDLPPVETLKQ